MSTSTLVQPMYGSNWKQEVSLRIAAHRNRKGISAVPPSSATPVLLTAGSPAAQAAARVAARYAHAPSYSQMQTLEAERAENAAARLQAAADAQALAARPTPTDQENLLHQSVFEINPIQIHPIQAPQVSTAPSAIQAAPRRWEPEIVAVLHESESPLAPQPAPPSNLDAWESEFAHLCSEPNALLRPADGAPIRVLPPRFFEEVDARLAAAKTQFDETETPSEGAETRFDLTETRFEQAAPSEHATPSLSENLWSDAEPQAVEPDQPINFNLIEFPRELVATRRMRPHLLESPIADESANRQLSIFEVDPDTISVQPEPVVAAAPWPGATSPAADWSDIELDAQPVHESLLDTSHESLSGLYLAPISHRLMASFVDSAIIAGAVLAAALVAAANLSHPLAPRAVEVCALSTIVIGSLLYHALFLLLSDATPGMRSAGVSLCTFDDQIPTHTQVRNRIGALALSLLPVGLGVLWVLFDEDHLCWHDRLSQTYLRKN